MCKSVWSSVLAALILLTSFFSTAKTIIYQPLNKDATVTLEQWKALIDSLHTQGYREIVIQWSQYGSVNFWRKDSFIKQPMIYALSKGFKFWLGLYIPDDYYQTMDQGITSRNSYFEKVIRENQHLLAKLQIQNVISQQQLLGWYLPTELTHRYLKTKNNNLNLDLLKKFVELNKKTTIISYFLGQDTSVEEGLSDLNTLQNLGFEVWLQRGNGLNKSTSAEQIINQMNCNFAVINENFQQTSVSGRPFSARSLKLPRDIVSSCHKPITFSLRYMPFSPFKLENGS